MVDANCAKNAIWFKSFYLCKNSNCVDASCVKILFKSLYLCEKNANSICVKNANSDYVKKNANCVDANCVKNGIWVILFRPIKALEAHKRSTVYIWVQYSILVCPIKALWKTHKSPLEDP